MEIDYGILEEFNVNKEEALTHLHKSAQVKKYVEGICNKEVIKSTRTRQAKGLKQLLSNIKDWKCSICNINHYQKTSYNKHITSIEHKVKLNGGKIYQCCNKKCRKKFCNEDELEQHFKDNRNCISISPKNKLKEDYITLMNRINKQKRLYRLFTDSKETMTDLDKEDYNIMISQDYNGNEDYELVKDEKGFLVVKQKEKQIEELTYTKKDITIKPDTTEDYRTHAEIYEDEYLEDLIERSNIEEARLKKEEEWKSDLRSDKFLGGYSSTSEEEEEVKLTTL
tara:strand:+ start:409 stop:1254 length:846 start_codon:yes stop_codon:yes gene_type:complete